MVILHLMSAISGVYRFLEQFEMKGKMTWPPCWIIDNTKLNKIEQEQNLCSSQQIQNGGYEVVCTMIKRHGRHVG